MYYRASSSSPAVLSEVVQDLHSTDLTQETCATEVHADYKGPIRQHELEYIYNIENQEVGIDHTDHTDRLSEQWKRLPRDLPKATVLIVWATAFNGWAHRI